MSSSKSVFNIHTIAILLFCIANVLELFVPRMDEENYFARLPIQAINGLLLVLMWTYLFESKIRWTPIKKSVLSFILLILTYSVVYAVYNKFNTSDYAPYLRFLLWTTSILFFSEMMLKFGINKKLMRIYIITFLVAVTKKIFEASLFESEKLGGGDTAALPLLFIIPLILMCFSDKTKALVISFVAVLALFSLRRTVILGFVICLPFIYRYISSKLKTYHVMLLGLVFVSLLVFAWNYIGDAIIYRFDNLLVGDAGGDKDTYGSGRSEFYLAVWDSWTTSGTFRVMFGKGLGSVSKLLMKDFNITHTHNDFLEIGHTFGLLGVGIWLFFLKGIWQLRSFLRQLNPMSLNLLYITFTSYGIIAMASGCVLRISTMPFAFSVAILIYHVSKRHTPEKAQHVLEPVEDTSTYFQVNR